METNILIGIQARTNSTRLPNKAQKRILGVSIIDHVVNAALKSSRYLNRFSSRTGVKSDVWVLVPEGDPLKEYLSGRDNINVFEGHKTDLVTRYWNLIEKVNPDYIVRITADCPLIPPFLITKCVKTAIKNGYDFLDNADPRFRCFFDGSDVEVLSKTAFIWLNEYAKEREHVCEDIRNDTTANLKRGHVFSYLDLSPFKLSVDTEKDYLLVNNQYKSVQNKKRKWEETFGKGSAHMF